MPATHLIVIGASAGGIAAVRTLLNGLPEKLPAAVCVVVHTSPEGPGLLASVLSRTTRLTVLSPDDTASLREGHVYVAPPDYHLIVSNRRVHLNHGPREHRFRPAIDPLFRTAAEHFAERTIGVILSGHMADGTHGLMRIKQAGGITLVQDPDDAEVPAMPLNAMRGVAVDYVLPANEMPRVIMGLLKNARGRASSPARVPRTERPNAERPAEDALRTHEMKGPPSPFTCPDCGGTLWEIKEGRLVRYRCHVGHGFTADSLRDGMKDEIEEALWSALRAIEEAIELRSRMRARAQGQRLSGFTTTLDQEIAELKSRAAALRALLLKPSAAGRRSHTSPQVRKAHG